MERRLPITLFIIAALLVANTPVRAQQQGTPRSQNRLFDPATVETIRGAITRIDSVQSARGPSTGLHVQLQTAEDTLPIHLGPVWFLTSQSMTLSVGDSLTVRGSRVTLQNTPALIAATVQHGPHALRLRDDAGRPMWRRQRLRR